MTLRTTLTLTDLPIICWRTSVTTSNVSAESDANYPPSNVANPSTALKWKYDLTDSPASALEFFRIDLASETINYVAIAGHNFSSQGIAVGLELASYNSPVGDADIIFADEVPEDDSPLIFIFSDTEVEDVRIRFVPTGTTPAEMAVVYVGQYTLLDEGIQGDHMPLPLARVREVVAGKSENGAFLGRMLLGEGLSSTAIIQNLTADFVRDELLDFLSFASEKPFFWIWSPLTYPEDTAFAWLENDPGPSLDIDGYWSIQLDMRGLGA